MLTLIERFPMLYELSHLGCCLVRQSAMTVISYHSDAPIIHALGWFLHIEMKSSHMLQPCES